MALAHATRHEYTAKRIRYRLRMRNSPLSECWRCLRPKIIDNSRRHDVTIKGTCTLRDVVSANTTSAGFRILLPTCVREHQTLPRYVRAPNEQSSPYYSFGDKLPILKRKEKNITGDCLLLLTVLRSARDFVARRKTK